MPRPKPTLSVVLAAAEKDGGCILWTGATERGYGRMRWREGKTFAHRWAWVQTYGEISDGMELHHVCRNKRCINTEHLELVTPREHSSIHEFGRWRRNLTHCFRGHEFTEANTIWNHKSNRRRCRICTRARERSSYGS